MLLSFFSLLLPAVQPKFPELFGQKSPFGVPEIFREVISYLPERDRRNLRATSQLNYFKTGQPVDSFLSHEASDRFMRCPEFRTQLNQSFGSAPNGKSLVKLTLNHEDSVVFRSCLDEGRVDPFCGELQDRLADPVRQLLLTWSAHPNGVYDFTELDQLEATVASHGLDVQVNLNAALSGEYVYNSEFRARIKTLVRIPSERVGLVRSSWFFPIYTPLFESIARLSLTLEGGWGSREFKQTIPQFANILTDLTIVGLGFVDLEPLRHLQKLKKLEIRDSAATDISPVTALPNLTVLNLVRLRNLRNFRFLGSLNSLTSVRMSHTPFEDLNLFSASAGSLMSLDVSETLVKDVSILESFTRLETLELHNTPIKFLSTLPSNLRKLHLQGTSVSDIRALGGLPSLEYVNLSYMPRLESIEPLNSCPSLQHVMVEKSLPSHLLTNSKLALLTARGVVVTY